MDRIHPRIRDTNGCPRKGMEKGEVHAQCKKDYCLFARVQFVRKLHHIVNRSETRGLTQTGATMSTNVLQLRITT